jgi:5S rRNA maturation endonuclease (ribonuclease M5)
MTAHTTLAPKSTSSRAEQYIISKGWSYRDNGEHILLEYCPVSGCDQFHCYVRISPPEKDGLWKCHKCSAEGNLFQLAQAQGDRLPPTMEQNVSSMQDWATTIDGKAADKEPLPNVMSCHRALLADPEAMDYLIAERGLTTSVIERMKLGITKRWMKKADADVKSLVIPYLSGDGKRVLYAKYRSLPPAPKAFDNSHGWDVPLFNVGCIKQGMDELFIVEGELDAITLICHGIENVVAVPGANTQKALWLTIVDNARPKAIYLLYDKDEVGQKAAKQMAAKFTSGGHNVLNLVLPDFVIDTDDDSKDVLGKDVNEWFRNGGSLEEFAALKLEARQFDVDGVVSIGNGLDELERKLLANEMLRPTYDFAWPTLTKKAGGMEPGDVVDIIAVGKVGKTTMAMNQLEHIRHKYGENVFMFCLEMTTDRMLRKVVSHMTNTDDSPALNDDDARKKRDAMLAAIPMAKAHVLQSKGDYLFGYTTVARGEAQKVFDIIRQVVRRYGVKWVCFDNLQLLCDLDLKQQNNRTVNLSQLSKQFKALATELKIVIIRIIQPNRVKPGEIVDSANSDGASQIEKDCDMMIALHRSKHASMRESEFKDMGFIDEDTTLEPSMLTKVALSRYSGGGMTTLDFHGATSTVREFGTAGRAELIAGATPQLGTVAAVEA